MCISASYSYNILGQLPLNYLTPSLVDLLESFNNVLTIGLEITPQPLTQISETLLLHYSSCCFLQRLLLRVRVVRGVFLFVSGGGSAGPAPARSCWKLPRLQAGPASGPGRAHR